MNNHAGSYKLDDARRRHRTSPDTFEIPSAEITDDLLAPKKRGDVPLAKLIFLPAMGHGGERLWVRVERRDGAQYVGKIDDSVVDSRLGLRSGDTVRFEARHVADVDVRRGSMPSIAERMKNFFSGW